MNNVFLDSLVNGDSAMIANLYKKSYPKVKKFVLQNKGNEEDAQDVFQKALLQIAVRHQKEAICITTNFNAYLFTVCKNLWRRELNTYKKRVTNVEAKEQVDEYVDAAYALIEQKRQELFVEKLGEISTNCKKILTMFFAKIPYAEIIKHTDYTSEIVVRQRVFKCKKKLTELIQKDSRFKTLKEE